MLDRSMPPPLRPIQTIKLPSYQSHTLPNGVPLYDVRTGTQDVVKLELHFDAGRWYEHRPLVARTTPMLLREGTASFSAKDIAELTDFYGATLRMEDGFDASSITLYCLTKHLEHLLPLMRELVTVPVFPETELADYVRRSKQRLLIDLEKVDVVAYRLFTEAIFGSNHPYGYNSSPEFYDTLTTSDLHQHFVQHFTEANCKIFISGKTNDLMLKQLESFFGSGLLAAQPEKRYISLQNHLKNIESMLKKLVPPNRPYAWVAECLQENTMTTTVFMY